MDFTGINNITYPETENILTETLSNLGAWGFEIELIEAKKTTGGYLSKADLSFPGFKIRLKIEISFRIRKQKSKGAVSRIKNNYIPHYDAYQLPFEEIISGKLNALVARAKARDWYDFYFFLHNQMLEAKHKKRLPELLEKLKRSKKAEFRCSRIVLLRSCMKLLTFILFYKIVFNTHAIFSASRAF